MATKLYLTSTAYTYMNYNLLTGTLALVEQSRKVTISGDRAIETMELVSARATTDIAIIQAENKLNELGEMARQYIKDNTVMYPVWLQENATSETLRQSLVYDIQVIQKEVAHTSKLLGRVGVSVWTLYIERAVWWEPVSELTQSTTGGAVASCGGADTIEVGTGVNSGVIDGRIAAAIIAPSNTQAREFWMGLRKPREATDVLSINTSSVWNLRYGTAGTDTALANEGTNPYSGTTNNIMQCTFATVATMATRVTINWAQVFASVTTNNFLPGKYLVLLRAKAGSSTECRVRMSSGYGTSLRVHNEVDISNTAYKLIPIGEVNLPSVGYRAATAAYGMEPYALSYNNIVVAAERLSGTGYLYLDVLVQMPSDALLYAKVTDFSSGDRVVAYTFPDGEQRVIRATSALVMQDFTEYALTNWRMPYMGPTEQVMQVLAVFAYQTATVQTAVDTLDYQVSHLPRYKGFSRYA